jgi:Heparinase II/III-like protein/Heparinase II/III N-terminus
LSLVQKLRKLKALLALGPANLLRVGIYRLGLKTGFHPVLRLSASVPVGPYLCSPEQNRSALRPTKSWQTTMRLFSNIEYPLKGKPDWLVNPFNPSLVCLADKHWSAIPDYDDKVGDIKEIWELSRWDWLLAMAQRASLGDATEMDRLNHWISDWLNHNPPFMGPNWKCAQEASIRVMHLAVSAIILNGEKKPSQGLCDLLSIHMKRIAPTLSYAIGQENNHGTSEAAALFIGGTWLTLAGDKNGPRYAKLGRKWLENRAHRLILEDGTFSQYSVVYHRMFLDTYAVVETWRRHLSLPEFSKRLFDKLASATFWMQKMVVQENGDAPNLGSNDGCNLLPLTESDFRDFRPSLQLAAALFLKSRALPNSGAWDDTLSWLSITIPSAELTPAKSQSFDKGGIHFMRRGTAMVYLRYPRFHFRPCQSDALHLDLWVDGQNILRDGGTYAYNTSAEVSNYFTGTESHCTAMFDGRDQMPRLGRYLFGSWLKAQNVLLVKQLTDSVVAASGYTDGKGAKHNRHVTLFSNKLTCQDTLDGKFTEAVIRWRLPLGDWRLERNQVFLGGASIKIEENSALSGIALVNGYESRYYRQKSALSVLEVTVRSPAVIRTEISF